MTRNVLKKFPNMNPAVIINFASDAYKKNKPRVYARVLKGTTFFGGAGATMSNEYMSDMKKALEQAGIKNIRVADVGKWSTGSLLTDGIDVMFDNNRDREKSDLSSFGTKGEQFNLIGFSYGGLQAAQAAADYADDGGIVDNLVLMATPIEKGFLNYLQNHPNIKSVRILNLTDKGDPVRAGMTDGEIIGVVPELIVQGFGEGTARIGHSYYSGSGSTGQARRRELASRIASWGLK